MERWVLRRFVEVDSRFYFVNVWVSLANRRAYDFAVEVVAVVLDSQSSLAVEAEGEAGVV